MSLGDWFPSVYRERASAKDNGPARAEIEADVQRFLASGGAIEVLSTEHRAEYRYGRDSGRPVQGVDDPA